MGSMTDGNGGQAGGKRLKGDAELQPNTQTFSVSVERSGSTVQIKLKCSDDYGAIKLYEEIVSGCGRGLLRLDIKAQA